MSDELLPCTAWDGHTHISEQFNGLLHSTRFSRATLLPFLTVFVGAYGMGGMLITSPVYFDELMIAEWLSDFESQQASIMMSAATSGMFVCWMVGAYFWARRADTHGRRGAALGSAWGTLVVSLLACASWSFYSFALLRSLLGLFIGGQAACSFLLMMEWSHPRDASFFTFLGNFSFSLGLVAMAGITAAASAMGLGWRAQQAVLCAVIAVPVAFGMAVLESPRWLLSVRRTEAAVAAIQATSYQRVCALPAGVELASISRTPPEGRSHLEEANEIEGGGAGGITGADGREGAAAEGAPPAGAWTQRMLLHLFIIACAWFVVNLLFYGLDFAVGACDPSAGCNPHVNGVLIAVADLPGYALSVLAADSPRFGRRGTLVASFGISAASLLALAALALASSGGVDEHRAVREVLAFLGKCGAASAFQVVYIYPAELFSASMSGKALGIANIGGRLACIIAPQAANIPQIILDLVLGITALVASGLVLLLPETLGTNCLM